MVYPSVVGTPVFKNYTLLFPGSCFSFCPNLLFMECFTDIAYLFFVTPKTDDSHW